MAINKAYNQYKQNSVFTAGPRELTLMLYNGLIKFIMQGQKAICDKDVQKANDSILRAQDIVREFQNTLDTSYEVSESLNLIYDYMYRKLVEANISKNEEILEEVLGFARQLRDTWEQAMGLAAGK